MFIIRMETPPFSWSLPYRLPEKITQMGLVSKAAFCGDLAERVVGRRQEPLSAHNARAHDILMWRAIKARLEYSVESVGSKLHHPNEIHHPDCGMQIQCNVRLDAACLPWRQNVAPRYIRVVFWSHSINSGK